MKLPIHYDLTLKVRTREQLDAIIQEILKFDYPCDFSVNYDWERGGTYNQFL